MQPNDYLQQENWRVAAAVVSGEGCEASSLLIAFEAKIKTTTLPPLFKVNYSRPTNTAISYNIHDIDITIPVLITLVQKILM